MPEREEELRQLILKKANECKKNKWLRIRITFYILSGIVYYIALDAANLNSAAELLRWLIFAPLIASGVMLISYMILGWIIDGVIKDNMAIAQLVDRLDSIKLSDKK